MSVCNKEESVKMSGGMSEKDMAKLWATTVAEVLKQLSLKENRMEHSSAKTSVKHIMPILKNDDLNE